MRQGLPKFYAKAKPIVRNGVRRGAKVKDIKAALSAEGLPEKAYDYFRSTGFVSIWKGAENSEKPAGEQPAPESGRQVLAS